MAYAIPNGSTFDFAATYSTAVPVTAISNANSAVVSATGHTFVVGDIVVLTTGWQSLNDRAFRVTAITANTSFTLGGIDTTSTNEFPVGASAGSVRKVLTWVRLPQIMESTFEGGEQAFLEWAFLEDRDQRRLPTSRSAMGMTLTVADDPAAPYVPIVEAADRDLQPRVQRVNLPIGGVILYNSITTITPTPTLTRDELMARTITLSMTGRPTRYTTA